ncbi:hypothetical protein B0T25DRAFT_562725 [Lasiosphaeria hispida]|uniref:MYND-type domain-containing protein n=1 Tax=Lasiosphaeria hispida TaxID=260671 RepID=A0AAJ0MKG9_9PEZI|nr:hypothetical protein B0T25DRAFT_562725 [Lasiosphaeria hispida]
MDVSKLVELPEGPLQKCLEVIRKNVDSPPNHLSQSVQLVVDDALPDRLAIHAPDSALGLLDPASTLHLSACIRCHKDGAAFKCAGCTAARYCSRECQVADRPYHKQLCCRWAQFDEAHRPSPRHTRCVFMDVDKPGPDFLWVEFDTEGGFSRSNLESLGFSLNEPSSRMNLMQLNRGGTTNKWSYFHVSILPKNLMNQRLNWAYLRSVAKAGQAYPHRGNMLYMAFSPPTAQQKACQPRDVTMFDWSEIVYFCHTDCSTAFIIDSGRFLAPGGPAIKLNCHGDRARYQIQAMERGTGCYNDLMQDYYHWVSPYVVMLQLPWVSRWAYMNVDLVITSSNPKAAQRNDQAALLDARAIYCPSTGVIDHIVHEPCGGTQLMFHTAGAEVHPHHLLAFNSFLARIIPAGQNRISHVAARRGHTTISELRPRVTKAEFAAFWEEYVASLDEETEVPTSPYDATRGPHAEKASRFGAEERAKIEAALRGGQQSAAPQADLPEQPVIHVIINIH